MLGIAVLPGPGGKPDPYKNWDRMNARNSDDERKSKRPAVDRRAPAGTRQDPATSLRKIKGALGRPLALERRDGQLRLVLADRRRAPQAEAEPLEAQIGAVLRARLAHCAREGRRGHEQLDLVSEAFEDKGWAGLAKLSSSVLGQALAQSQALAREESSDVLKLFVDRLGQIRDVVNTREERIASRRASLESASVVVSESTPEEFEALQRSWAGTVPGGLGPPQADGSGDPR